MKRGLPEGKAVVEDNVDMIESDMHGYVAFNKPGFRLDIPTLRFKIVAKKMSAICGSGTEVLTLPVL